MPKISIIIPVYGVEKFIKQCMDSVLSQTLKDIEIVLVDDGSKDNCPQIIDDYAKQDSRVVAIHQINAGYGKAVNHGIDVATGEYVGIVEPDDWIESNMFEVLYKKAVETNADFVKSDFYRYVGDKNTNEVAHIIPSAALDRTVKPREYVECLAIGPCIWSAIYKKGFLSENKIRLLETPGASYQDTGFHFKTSLIAERACFVSQPLYHYRIDNMGSSVKDVKKVFCVCDEWDDIIRWAKELGIYDELSGLLCALQYKTYMWNWKRLAGSVKNVFLKRFSEDFKAFYNQGILKKEYFKKKNYRRLQQIMFHPHWFNFFYTLMHLPRSIFKKYTG